MRIQNLAIVKRDSVSMGDDCTAPNTCEFKFDANEKISDLFFKIYKYLPAVSDSVWSINNQGNILGYISFAEDSFGYELLIDNSLISGFEDMNFYCKYYHKNRLLDFSTNPPELLYPECITLLEKVKKYDQSKSNFY